MPPRNRPDVGNLGLPELVNYVIDGMGRPSFDRLSDATVDPATGERAIAANSLANLANANRPVGRAPEVSTLIGASIALQHHVTPWALYVAAGVSLEEKGLTGRPEDAAVAALHSLPPGWTSMDAVDFSVWTSTGRALIDARAASDSTDELTRLRAENEQLRTEVESLRGHTATRRRKAT